MAPPTAPLHRRSTGSVGRPHDRGAVAVEVALLTPVIVMLVGLFVFGYRFWATRAGVQSAAAAAARAASLASSPQAGARSARQLALANLDALGVGCRSSSVDTQTDALSLPAGQPGSVRVSVTCVVSMSDLVLPGAPGSLTVSRSAGEPIDTFRERQP